jgi:hypothetical protein
VVVAALLVVVWQVTIGSGYFRDKPSPVRIPQQFSNLVILHLPVYEDVTECYETSAHKIQTPGNYSEENIQHPEHGEGLKSRIFHNLKDLERDTHNKTQTP